MSDNTIHRNREEDSGFLHSQVSPRLIIPIRPTNERRPEIIIAAAVLELTKETKLCP